MTDKSQTQTAGPTQLWGAMRSLIPTPQQIGAANLDALESGIAQLERKLADRRGGCVVGATTAGPSEQVLRAVVGVLQYAKALEARLAVLEAANNGK